MIALDRQGWILVGFGVLFFSAIVVSVCGWLLWWRTRRPRPTDAAEASPGPEPAPDPEEPPGPHPEDEPDEPRAEEAPTLPPGNPLR